ncbi:hypothetical protein BH23ACT7_BH23ACT7_22400 [soil metagenome]
MRPTRTPPPAGDCTAKDRGAVGAVGSPVDVPSLAPGGTGMLRSRIHVAALAGGAVLAVGLPAAAQEAPGRP